MVQEGGRELSTNIGHHGDLQKIKRIKNKINGLNVPKQSPKKTKFGQKCKWFKISQLKFFSWKYYFGISGIQIFYIRPHVLVNMIRVFFNFRFSNRKYKSQQKLAKKITHFTNENLTYFTNLNLFDIENNMLP